jgi:hypothetical protein
VGDAAVIFDTLATAIPASLKIGGHAAASEYDSSAN